MKHKGPDNCEAGSSILVGVQLANTYMFGGISLDDVEMQIDHIKEWMFT